MSEMIATANATRACAKDPPDTGYPVSGGSVILRLYGGSAQRLLFGERLVPDLNGLELGHPAVRFKLAFPCIQQTLLHAPLSGLGLLGIGDVCKGGLCGGFGLALLSPAEQCQLAAVCGDGCALGQEVVQDHAGGDLVAAQMAAPPTATAAMVPPVVSMGAGSTPKSSSIGSSGSATALADQWAISLTG